VNRTHVGKSRGKVARDPSLIARYGNDGDERRVVEFGSRLSD